MSHRPLVCALTVLGLCCISVDFDQGSARGLRALMGPNAVQSPSERLVRDFFAARNTALSPTQIDALAAVIVEESERSGLEVELILAVIHVESSGRNFAVSRVGARGLMQLRPTTAAAVADEIGVDWHGPATLFDPVTNVRLGVAYLEQLLDRFGDLPTAIAAYNEGPTRIASHLRNGRELPAMYTDRVLRSWGEGARS